MFFFSFDAAGSEKQDFVVLFFAHPSTGGLDGRHVGDAGADAALVVDALKVSLAVGRRRALVARRARFRVGTCAAADSNGIPIDAEWRCLSMGSWFGAPYATTVSAQSTVDVLTSISIDGTGR